MTMNLITGIAAIVIGAAYSLMAYFLPRAPFGDPSRHIVFPLVVGLGMLVLGAALTAREVLSGAAAKGQKVALPKTLTRYGREIAVTICASVVYALIFEKVGYVLATVLYLGTILFLINSGKKGRVTNILVAVVFSVGIYALFAYVLGIQLPPMPFLEI